MVSSRFERHTAVRAVAGLTGMRNTIDEIEIFSEVEAAGQARRQAGVMRRLTSIAESGRYS